MLLFVAQGGSEARVPLTAGQKREVDDAFAVFDYAKTGLLDLHEVKVNPINKLDLEHKPWKLCRLTFS